ncbi:MAG: Panacea domain-containing protein, partial [Nitrospiria bacterium]
MTAKRKFFRFDPEKALQAILFVARMLPGATFHQISKIIYFADKAHLQKYGRLICGDTYVAMKHGPVPSGIYDILKSVRGDGSSECTEQALEALEVQN